MTSNRDIARRPDIDYKQPMVEVGEALVIHHRFHSSVVKSSERELHPIAHQ